MIDKHGERIAGDVVAAAGQEDRLRRSASAQHLLEATREVIELTAAVRHDLDGIASVRHGMDVVAVVVVEVLQHVVERVVEPRIALRHQRAGTGAREQAFRQGHLRPAALACGLDVPLDDGGAPAMLARAVRANTSEACCFPLRIALVSVFAAARAHACCRYAARASTWLRFLAMVLPFARCRAQPPCI